MLSYYIEKLVRYGLSKGLIEEDEAFYSRNLLLDMMKESEFDENDREGEEDPSLVDILGYLCDEAVKRGLIEDSITFRDLFDTKLMNAITPRPHEVNRAFKEKYKTSPEEATDYFYKLCRDINYIRTDRIARDMRWTTDTPYGTLDITINLSKPEKDPKAIAAAKNQKQSAYPKCQLCMENIGYAGRANHPARENLRVIPVKINDLDFGFQYSPYVYYNEHCIVFNSKHVPMKIDKDAFLKLFDFVDLFPHYFLGSNADLPIVGGSILTHDHFQGGRYVFAMEKAKKEREFFVDGFPEVSCAVVKWPLSVIRLNSKDRKALVELADRILQKWRSYSDEEAFIFAETDGEPHNTITPIARKHGDIYEMDLALRNNITTKEHPLGLFHPHEELHHIKKENIGLIEVMGLAVLPARLKAEMTALSEAMLSGADIEKDETLSKHAIWAKEVMERHTDLNKDNIMAVLQEEIGQVFLKVLLCAGVFKDDGKGREAFKRFTDSL
ncbi:MAG: UDP-glucose--hexose-1-phosphate uridylyltransferase [Lachnospiraceae bacterium]|nr:UDP-glucose--hexose-1-phosphate uridylyltransferase [Lachnospiraceae bacterium]MBQ6258544.1 UDP-glucose--hexose-1-phosphate uridylyltransferase [Lachnospiraceae bacterium]